MFYFVFPYLGENTVMDIQSIQEKGSKLTE